MGRYRESTTTNSPRLDLGKLYVKYWMELSGQIYGETFAQNRERHFWRRIRQSRKDKE